MSGLVTSTWVPLLRALTEQYAKQMRPKVLDLAKARRGREILGAVAGRPETEDVHVEIDRICEKPFARKCAALAKKGLRVRIISEHSPEGYEAEDPDVICYLDPFDGTDQFRRGIWEGWYSVFSFVTPDGQDLFGACLDFITGILYTAYPLEGKVVQRFDDGTTLEVVPSKETELSGDSVVASYKGRWGYLAPWFMIVEGLFSRPELKGVTHYSWGGSFVYAYIAAGIVTAYLMPGEPTDEIKPGRAFVAAARLDVASITDEGIPRRFQWSQMRRVPILVVTPNRKLTRSIVDKIWEKDGEETPASLVVV